MKTIIVATDGSEPAQRAVRLAGELAGLTKAELHIVTVGEKLNPAMRKFADAENTSAGDVIESLNRSTLCDARELAMEAGAITVRSHGMVGDAADNILAVMDKHRPDMLLVGRRGRGRLEGLLLGSVSQKLSSLARCAVTIVP